MGGGDTPARAWSYRPSLSKDMPRLCSACVLYLSSSMTCNGQLDSRHGDLLDWWCAGVSHNLALGQAVVTALPLIQRYKEEGGKREGREGEVGKG